MRGTRATRSPAGCARGRSASRPGQRGAEHRKRRRGRGWGFRCGSCGAASAAPSPVGNRDATPFLIVAVIIVVSKVLEPQARCRFPARQPRAGPGAGGCQQGAGRRAAESGWRGPARYPEQSGRRLFTEHLAKHCAELCASHSAKRRQATPVGRGQN